MDLRTSYTWKLSASFIAKRQESVTIMQTLDHTQNWVSTFSVSYWTAAYKFKNNFVSFFTMKGFFFLLWCINIGFVDKYGSAWIFKVVLKACNIK